jgi:hypothetical protein
MATTTTGVCKSRTGAQAAPSLFGELAELIRAVQTLFGDSYRPELHYMRGPGPKWHAKYDPAPVMIKDAAVAALTYASA